MGQKIHVLLKKPQTQEALTNRRYLDSQAINNLPTASFIEMINELLISACLKRQSSKYQSFPLTRVRSQKAILIKQKSFLDNISLRYQNIIYLLLTPCSLLTSGPQRDCDNTRENSSEWANSFPFNLVFVFQLKGPK